MTVNKHAMPRAEVMAFALAMEKELRLNEHKGQWRMVDPVEHLRRLEEEVVELREMLQRRHGGKRPGRCVKRITQEAADVANFAMIIADAVGGLEG